MNKNLYIILVISLLICSFGIATVAAQSSFHEQYKVAKLKNDTTSMIQSLKLWGDSLSEEADFEHGDSLLTMAIALSEASKNNYEAGIIYNLLASNASYSGNRPLALHYYHKALKAFYDIRDADKVAMIMLNMGSEYEYAGNLKLAIVYKLKALKNKLASGKKKNLDYYYQQVGQLFKETNTDKWEFYVKKAYEVSRTLPDSRIQTKAGIFNDLGGISKLRGKNDEAMAWYDSMLVISQANNYITGLGTAYSNRSLIYMSQEKYPEAFADVLKAIDYAQQSGKIYAQILDRIHAANILEKMNRYAEAGLYAQKALTLAREYKTYPEEEAQAHLALARIGEKTKDWKMAYDHYNAYKEGVDSLRNADVEKNLHEMELKYQTSEKEKEIERLDYENKVKTLKYQRRKSLFAAVVFIMLLFAAMLFLWSRRKLSKTRKEQAELREKLLRSQMNPHFIFNTLNAINQYVQSGKSEEASGFLSRYTRLMRQILENSNERFISLTDEIEFLNNYLKIQQLRFGISFEYKISVGEGIDADNTEIPPMIAQPLIENAVEHGIRGVENGLITVSFSFVKKELILTVTDNGVGVKNAEPTANHRSMAIDITLGRLQMPGGRPDSLTIESPVPETQSGTRVSLAIPFKTYS